MLNQHQQDKYDLIHTVKVLMNVCGKMNQLEVA